MTDARPVIAEADLELVQDLDLSGAPPSIGLADLELIVSNPFVFPITRTVTNHGPFGPVDAGSGRNIVVPAGVEASIVIGADEDGSRIKIWRGPNAPPNAADVTLTNQPAGTRIVEPGPVIIRVATNLPGLAVGETRTLTGEFDLHCLEPGFYPVTFVSGLLAFDQHILDPNEPNGQIRDVELACLTPRFLKAEAISELEALLLLVDGETAEEIEDAIRDIEESLDPARWVDEFRLVCRSGDFVFKNEQEAVETLMELLGQRVGDDDDDDDSDDGDSDDGDSDDGRPLDPAVVAELERVILKLARADALIAGTARRDSTDPVAREKALADFEKARAARLEERWDRYIHHLREGWNFVKDCPDDETDTGTRSGTET